MRTFLTLWRRELEAYFLSPIAYLVMVFFLALLGSGFSLLATVLVNGEGGATVMKELFGSIVFWLALLVVAPLLTMRLLAEEKRQGTLETLMTAPVTDAQVVLAKFAGALSFYVVLWLPTLSYAFILRRFSSTLAPVDLGPMLSGYLGALLIGAFYLSAGLFCSALTRSQVVSAMMCFGLLGASFFAGFLHYVASDPKVRLVGGYISSVAHMLDFSRGAVDSRPVVLYLTGTALLLFFAVKALEARRWKGSI